MQHHITRFTTLILLVLLLIPTLAQEHYPTFSKEYWENEQEVAQGKIARGAGLAIAGAVLLWPTSVMISKAKDNPHKYVPLSIVFGAASLGALGHGISSMSGGKKEKATADYWVDQYTINPDSTDISKQQNDYIDQAQTSALKTTLFGVYSTSVAAVLLTNGIIQSSRTDTDVASDDITVWPYYAIGGTLLPMGIMAIVKSRKSNNDLEHLATTNSLTSRSQFLPFVTVSLKGDMIYGAVYSLRF